MDKISVNVTDSVYGSKCNACNSVYAISLSNRVVFLEGAQETKKRQNRNPILPFFMPATAIIAYRQPRATRPPRIPPNPHCVKELHIPTIAVMIVLCQPKSAFGILATALLQP